MRDKVLELQREVQFLTRENFIVDREVKTLDLKIGLVIRNLLKAEVLLFLSLRSLFMLASSSFFFFVARVSLNFCLCSTQCPQLCLLFRSL